MKLTKEQLQELLSNVRLDHKGSNLYADCPWCGFDEFGISLNDNHVFNCFRKKECGETGNIYKLLKKLGKSKDFVKHKEIDLFGGIKNGLEEIAEHIDLTLPAIQPPLLWKRSYQDPYCIKRGLTEDQFQKYEIGRSILNKEYVTFLVRREGVLVGHVTRSERSKEWIDKFNVGKEKKDKYLRYKNSTTDFQKTLFGIDEVIEGVTTDVILVEGIFSKTKTDTNLYLDQLDEMKCCATFGAKFSRYQIELLRQKKVKNIWLWFEADVLQKVKDVATYASQFFKVRVSYLSGRDPNDIDEQGAIQLLDEAKDYLDFNMSFVKSKLQPDKWNL